MCLFEDRPDYKVQLFIEGIPRINRKTIYNLLIDKETRMKETETLLLVLILLGNGWGSYT